jgi:hypothetical protein
MLVTRESAPNNRHVTSGRRLVSYHLRYFERLHRTTSRCSRFGFVGSDARTPQLTLAGSNRIKGGGGGGCMLQEKMEVPCCRFATFCFFYATLRVALAHGAENVGYHARRGGT